MDTDVALEIIDSLVESEDLRRVDLKVYVAIRCFSPSESAAFFSLSSLHRTESNLNVRAGQQSNVAGMLARPPAEFYPKFHELSPEEQEHVSLEYEANIEHGAAAADREDVRFGT